MSETSKGVKALIILSIVSIILSGFVLLYVYMTIQNLPGGGTSQSTFYYLSGTHTGDIIFNNTVYVRASDIALLKDGHLMGGEIYIFGQLTLQNITIDQDMTVKGNGVLYLTDVILRESARISVEDTGTVDCHNLQNYANLSVTQLYVYDNSTVIMNNTVLRASFYDSSVLNATELKTWTEFESELTFFDYSQATIINSTLDESSAGLPSLQDVFSKVIFNNSVISIVSARYYSTYYIYNGTTINTYWGYDNSIVYNSSSTINTLNLAGSAQKIDI